MRNDLNAALAWLHGVITTLKPAVAAFITDVGAMTSNRPAPAGEVVISMAVLVVLVVLVVPRAFKKVITK